MAIPIRCDALNPIRLIWSPSVVDRLAILLERFAVTASVFHAGALCGILFVIHKELHR